MPKIAKLKQDTKTRPDFVSAMKTPLNFFSRVVGANFVVEVDVPGMQVTDINVSIFDNFISVAGHRVGIPWNTAIPVDDKVYDPSTCSAFFKDGILQLMFDKWPDTPPVKVVIATSDDQSV